MSAIRSIALDNLAEDEADPSPVGYLNGVPDGQLDDAEALLEHFEQLEQRFENLRQHLTRSHRLTTLGTLASIIAHEYNNILTPMLSYAQMAMADPDNPELMRKAVEKSLAGAERAAKVSSSLLGFSREHDARTVAPLRETLDEAVATLARPPQRDGITLSIDVPDIDLAIDPLSLQQVLVNILLNACKAMRRTGGTITIRAEVRSAASDRPLADPHAPDTIYLTIADNGPGIPHDIRDRVFEPFVTQGVAPDNASEDEKGTGLGLCICRDLITAADGSIRVESIPKPQPDHGATFHIELPIAQEQRGGEIQST